MTHSHWKIAGCTLLLSAAVATYSVAQDTSASGSAQGSAQSGSAQGSAQGTAQSGSTHGSAQGSAGTSSSDQSSNQQGQASSNTSSSQGTTQQSTNQTNQKSSDRSATGSTSSRDNQAQTNQNQSDQSGSSRNTSARSNTDRSYSQDRRDSRDSYDRNRDRDDRNANDRDRSDRDRSDRDRSDRNTSRDRDSHHDMRGPDIGIWFGRNSRDGLVISDVSSKGAIARFGFREGDRIVSVDGRRVTTEADFIQYVLHGDSDRVKIIVIRDGREEVIYVEPQLLTSEYEVETTQVDPLERFGIIVDDRYDDRIVVWRVIPRSPAYYAGFRPGDVVVNFGGRPYKTRTEFERSAGDWKEGEVEVQVRRGDKTRDLSVDMPKYDRSTSRAADRRANRIERRTDNGRRAPILNRGR